MNYHTYWLGGTITLAKEVSKKDTKKAKKWGVRILVFVLAAMFIIMTLVQVIPALFA